MKAKIAINGYGRIGQCVLRALYETGRYNGLTLVAINDLAPPETIAHLTRYDSTHGRFARELSLKGRELSVGGDPIALFNEVEVERLPWGELGIDLVLECTGTISTGEEARRHLAAGGERVLLSQPGVSGIDRTVIYGFNEDTITGDERVVSNASCSTNCIVPVIAALDERFGIESGTITTVHSAMNDQPAVDVSHHSDLRRSRSAMQSIIPVETKLAMGIDKLLPHLAGRFSAIAMRVPTLNVSVITLAAVLGSKASASEVNAYLKEVSADRFEGVLGYTEEPLASCDFNHDPRSAVVDGTQTRVAGENLLKIFCWFDNEWGYANRLLDVAGCWLGRVNEVRER
ncbi:MAG: erythrose-4-phosphate dehydrogenase [Deltaproteobacteria bacterium]|nr:MAG: erythrose-4-phosphate dehydrogenase [Deltaproteobacteria bacterium]